MDKIILSNISEFLFLNEHIDLFLTKTKVNKSDIEVGFATSGFKVDENAARY